MIVALMLVFRTDDSDIVAGSFERGNEFQSSVKPGEFLESQRTFSFTRCVLFPVIILLAS